MPSSGETCCCGCRLTASHIWPWPLASPAPLLRGTKEEEVITIQGISNGSKKSMPHHSCFLQPQSSVWKAFSLFCIWFFSYRRFSLNFILISYYIVVKHVWRMPLRSKYATYGTVYLSHAHIHTHIASFNILSIKPCKKHSLSGSRSCGISSIVAKFVTRDKTVTNLKRFLSSPVAIKESQIYTNAVNGMEFKSCLCNMQNKTLYVNHAFFLFFPVTLR